VSQRDCLFNSQHAAWGVKCLLCDKNESFKVVFQRLRRGVDAHIDEGVFCMVLHWGISALNESPSVGFVKKAAAVFGSSQSRVPKRERKLKLCILKSVLLKNCIQSVLKKLFRECA